MVFIGLLLGSNVVLSLARRYTPLVTHASMKLPAATLARLTKTISSHDFDRRDRGTHRDRHRAGQGAGAAGTVPGWRPLADPDLRRDAAIPPRVLELHCVRPRREPFAPQVGGMERAAYRESQGGHALRDLVEQAGQRLDGRAGEDYPGDGRAEAGGAVLLRLLRRRLHDERAGRGAPRGGRALRYPPQRGAARAGARLPDAAG